MVTRLAIASVVSGWLRVSLPAAEGEIRLGEPLSGRWVAAGATLEGRGSAERFDYVAQASGAVTISLESFDLDAFLRVEGEAGEVLGEDDNGGVESNARIVLQATRGSRYRLVAAAAVRADGEFTLSVSKGEVPLPAGRALADAAVAFRSEAAERALARGDKGGAGRHRLEEGVHLREVSRLAEARSVFESASALTREANDLGTEALALGYLGIVCRDLGDLPVARASLERYLGIARERRDLKGEVWVLGFLGNLCSELRDPPSAREHFETLASLARTHGLRANEADAFEGLGILHTAMEETAKARECHERQVAIARELGDSLREAWGLLHLGLLEEKLGNYAAARENHERALAIFRRVGNVQGQTLALQGLGSALMFEGKLLEALAQYEEALDLSRTAKQAEAEMSALGNLGHVLHRLGDQGHARAYLEECLALSKRLGMRREEALALLRLGTVSHALGNYPEALDLLERSFDLSREISDPKTEGECFQRLGQVFTSLGNSEKARAHYQKRLAGAHERGDLGDEASALTDLGHLALTLEDYSTARRHYEAALDLQRRRESPIYEAWALLDLARAHRRLAEFKVALDLDARALELFREAGSREGEIRVVGNRGTTLEGLGDAAGALRSYDEHLVLARAMGYPAEEARALGNLAELSFEQGDLGTARDWATSAIAAWEAMGGGETALEALQTLARIAITEGNVPAALEVFEEANRLLERPSLRQLEIAETAGVRSRFASWGRLRQELAALRVSRSAEDIQARGSVVSEGFREAGLWKGRALLEGIVEHHRGGRTAEAIRIRRDRRTTLARRDDLLARISQMIRERGPESEVESLLEESRALRKEADALAHELRKVSPGDALLDLPRGVDPDEVRRDVLRRGTILVDYVEGESRLFSYVVTEKDVHFLDLGDRETIEEAAASYRACLTDLEPAREIARRGRALCERLLDPVLSATGDEVERLVVVPTPSLSALPFETLVLGPKETKEPPSFSTLEFVLDRYEVCYGPSSPVLVELAKRAPRAVGRALLLADPLYAAESMGPRGTPEASAWVRLEKTRAEGLAVARVFLDPDEREPAARLAGLANRRSDTVKAQNFELCVGEDASRERLAGSLQPFSVLHLATHGYAGREFPRRTGIVLAARNGEDGYFTIQDVLELDLDASLVVLSACETARGEERAGEGVESMARAFMYAGARGVIASSWEVVDWAAADVMEHFYNGWVKNRETPALALREAKRRVRRAEALRGVTGTQRERDETTVLESGHPFFWGPILYIGLPR
jgi:CHAT domain-containing protein/Tfp pilus assembly protein PilF